VVLFVCDFLCEVEESLDANKTVFKSRLGLVSVARRMVLALQPVELVPVYSRLHSRTM
jgi:hypothetical protein